MAYVDGEADERVRDHVDHCPACAAKVAQLRETSQALLTLMYRANCPAPEILGQYQLDLLSSAERLKIAAHVRACPHCTRELTELGKEEDSLILSVLQTLKDVVQVIEATLMPPRRLKAVGMRGMEAGRRAFHFHSDDVDVLVGFQPVATGSRAGTLLGTVAQVEAVSGGYAWLFQEGRKPVSSPVDHLGTFTFGIIAPGEYDLALEVRERALLMRGVVI